MQNELVEAVARAVNAHLAPPMDGDISNWHLGVAQAALAAYHAHLAEQGLVIVPEVPTEGMWGGLARAIIMWLDFDERPTPRSLFKHLERSGHDIPQWLRDEPELKSLDHAISKGTRAVIIYTAMIQAAKER